jgi:hypothetical protein
MNGTETRRPWHVTVELSEPRDFNGETRVFTKDHEDANKKQLSALRPAPEIKVVNDRVTLRLRVDGATELPGLPSHRLLNTGLGLRLALRRTSVNHGGLGGAIVR